MPARAAIISLSSRSILANARTDQPEVAMIDRFPGLTPTRSRAVVHGDLVLTVAAPPDPVTSSMYQQSVKALARIVESLALRGPDQSKILSAVVYITDIQRNGEM